MLKPFCMARTTFSTEKPTVVQLSPSSKKHEQSQICVSILASFWKPFGMPFLCFYNINFGMPFWMPLFRLLGLKWLPKRLTKKGCGGFGAPQGPKGDPKAIKKRKVPRDRFRIDCPMVARMPRRSPRDRHWTNLGSFLMQYLAIFVRTLAPFLYHLSMSLGIVFIRYFGIVFGMPCIIFFTFVLTNFWHNV